MVLRTFIVGLILSIGYGINAQDFKQPVPYLEYIGEEYTRITKDQWSYTKAVGHGKGSRKIDKRRLALAQSILEAKRKIARMPPFKAKTHFRDSVVEYMTVSYHVINEDYAKIVDMEEVAEQSYDAMEEYLLAKEKASEKMALAAAKVDNEQERFVKDNDINLIENKSKLGEKMKKAGKVFSYYKKVYLIFFKSFKQEAYLIDGLNSKDLNVIEQNKSALLNYSLEGREKLKTLTNFQGDQSLYISARQLLQFYSKEAEVKTPVQMEYFIKSTQFEKIKTAFDKIKPSKRTQADIDKYNDAVNLLNSSMNEYNSINEELNKSRSKLLDNWNKKVKTFLDKHVP